jgi:hypothetical protein
VHFPDLSWIKQNLDNPRMEKAPSFDPFDYTLAIKNKGRLPKSWRWEIYAAGKSKPLRQSEFFGTMSEATRDGKMASAQIRANRTARDV